MSTELTGWGRYPRVDAALVAGEDLASLSRDVSLSRGLGRAYGDAALPASGGRVLHTVLADRFLEFDAATGVLRAEAGLSQSTLMRTLLAQNWFTPVSPGTQYVTLGGMVASDIHGKNHHVHGTFGNFVRALTLRLGTGDVVRVTPDSDPPLFWATLGGMGLTGHILDVEVALEQLASPYIYEESERFGSLREAFAALNEAGEHWPMTVCWVDTSGTGARMGRGILNRGRWATADEAPSTPPILGTSPAVPDVFPNGVMNPFSVGWMNAVWYWLHGAGSKQHVISPDKFYYQLDLLREWNRGYGKRGFTQYQCVMPRDPVLYEAFLRRFQALGGCSFITVLKDTGPQGPGMLSFPQEGTTLAVDIPLNDGVPKLIHELNAMVIANGGRIYLAKDAFTTPSELRAMYPRIDEFLAVRERVDPQKTLTSALSQRLFGF